MPDVGEPSPCGKHQCSIGQQGKAGAISKVRAHCDNREELASAGLESGGSLVPTTRSEEVL